MEELKFEKLSDVPVVEELADGDYVIAVKDGQVVRIEKTTIVGEPTTMFVTFSNDGSGNIVCDKTYNEIYEAWEKGVLVYAKMNTSTTQKMLVYNLIAAHKSLGINFANVSCSENVISSMNIAMSSDESVVFSQVSHE